MELTRIIINESSDQHIIFLKEVDGDRMFPIVIGFFEASSIERRVKNLATQRPLTHDLLASTIDLLGVHTLMWASDYPHPDSTWPESQDVVAKHFDGLPDDQKQAIVWKNAAHLYGLS